MKPTKILMCAMAVGAMIFAAGNASAVLGVVNVSGTALSETDTNPSSGVNVAKVTKDGFKTKDILSLLADATGNGWFTNKGSQLVYDPDAFNAAATDEYNLLNTSAFSVFGIFYVTNTITHDVFQLDGVDESDNYFSYIEFDSYPGNQGFWNDPSLGENSVRSGKADNNTGKSSSNATLHGLLYIHSDPSQYDITDFPGSVFLNNQALVIRGLGTFSDSNNSTTQTEFFTLSGSGDGFFSTLADTSPVITGIVTFKGQGPIVD
jgi:hypothetical protein